MNLRGIWTVFRKEFRENLRDKRTLLSALVFGPIISPILVAVLVGGFMGKSAAMTEGAFSTAKSAVMDIALPLVGLMAIWLGMMRLAERAGLVQLLLKD